MHSAVPVSSFGIQVTTRWGGAGGEVRRKEGEQTGEGANVREEETGDQKRKGSGECEEAGRHAGRFSPILDDEIHQGQGGLVGDSDSQVQGELSRRLDTGPHL